MPIALYDVTHLDALEVPDSELGRLIQGYWLPLMRAGSQAYIQNVNTDLRLLQVDDLLLPVTVCRWHPQNSYVCSPYAHYITYAREELYTLRQPFWEGVLANLLTGLGELLRWGNIDQVVIVNNWLLSTNLYPALSEEQLRQITQFLVAQFPTHSILFRSLNAYRGQDWLDQFQANGYGLITSRQVYLFDPQQPTALRTKMRWRLKQDLKLFTQTGYQILGAEALHERDVPRLLTLYNQLYLDKYCRNNPQFTEAWLASAMKTGVLTVKVLERAGQIDGVVGFYQLNGMMTTPLLGYDTSLPQSLGLYRMLSRVLMVEAEARGVQLHQSSGAASFKRYRGFTAHLEYTGFYVQHLGADSSALTRTDSSALARTDSSALTRSQQKLTWLLLCQLVNRGVQPLLLRYGL